MPSYFGGLSFSLCIVASASVDSASAVAVACDVCPSAIVWKVLHTAVVGIKLSFLLCAVLFVLGCYPVALPVVELP